jgi:HK97 family phage prohead protease
MPRQKPSTLCVRAAAFAPTRSSITERSGDEQGDGRTLTGYAAIFNTATEINSYEGHFVEQISRGAFRKTLQERTPILQFDHGHDSRTGSVPIGRFVHLREDSRGLFVEARLFDNPVVEPIRQAIDGGAITGMSFRFRVVRDEWTDKDGKRIKGGDELLDLLWSPGDRGPLNRTIREVQLFEAGPVVFPAYEATSVGVRVSEQDRRDLAAQYVLDVARDALPQRFRAYRRNVG